MLKTFPEISRVLLKIGRRARVLIHEYMIPQNWIKLKERKSHTRSNQRILEASSEAILNFSKVPLPDVPNLERQAINFMAERGYFPISFGSFKQGGFNSTFSGVRKLVSKKIPGEGYSFDSEEEYLREYQESYWAITHKKGGWDCYRHLEILTSGCAPLMHDVHRAPVGSMFYYPKQLLALLFERYSNYPFIPEPDVYEYLKSWSSKYLSTQAVASQVMRLSTLNKTLSGNRILFVDPDLAHSVDYLSLMTLVGFLQCYPGTVDIYKSPPRYLFDSFTGATSKLYGLGFGYSKLMPTGSATVVKNVDFGNYHTIVVGHATRNRDFIEYASDHPLTKNLIIIDGRDEAPQWTRDKWLLDTTGTLFIRES